MGHRRPTIITMTYLPDWLSVPLWGEMKSGRGVDVPHLSGNVEPRILLDRHSSVTSQLASIETGYGLYLLN